MSDVLSVGCELSLQGSMVLLLVKNKQTRAFYRINVFVIQQMLLLFVCYMS